ncbi:MAG: ACT domain-containing protein [Verrucomicrobiota bacterium]
MKIHQLSVFLENAPGHLATPCAVLADAGINILTLTLADTQRFGILRLILREWEQAQQVLEKSGFVVKVTEVVAVQVEDRPGGLRNVLQIVEQSGVNIEYMYAFTVRAGGKSIMVFRLDNTDKGIAALLTGGAKILSAEELYELAGQGK